MNSKTQKTQKTQDFVLLFNCFQNKNEFILLLQNESNETNEQTKKSLSHLLLDISLIFWNDLDFVVSDSNQNQIQIPLNQIVYTLNVDEIQNQNQNTLIFYQISTQSDSDPKEIARFSFNQLDSNASLGPSPETNVPLGPLKHFLNNFVQKSKQLINDYNKLESHATLQEISDLLNNDQVYFAPSVKKQLELFSCYLNRNTESGSARNVLSQFPIAKGTSNFFWDKKTKQTIHCTQLNSTNIKNVVYYSPSTREFHSDLHEKVYNFDTSLDFYHPPPTNSSESSESSEFLFSLDLQTDQELNWFYHTMMGLIPLYVDYGSEVFQKTEVFPLMRKFPFESKSFNAIHSDLDSAQIVNHCYHGTLCWPSSTGSNEANDQLKPNLKIHIQLSPHFTKNRRSTPIGKDANGAITENEESWVKIRVFLDSEDTSSYTERWLDLVQEKDNLIFNFSKKRLEFFFCDSWWQFPFTESMRTPLLQRLNELNIPRNCTTIQVLNLENLECKIEFDHHPSIHARITNIQPHCDGDQYLVSTDDGSNYYVTKSDFGCNIETKPLKCLTHNRPNKSTIAGKKLFQVTESNVILIDKEDFISVNGVDFYQLYEIQAYFVASLLPFELNQDEKDQFRQLVIVFGSESNYETVTISFARKETKILLNRLKTLKPGRFCILYEQMPSISPKNLRVQFDDTIFETIPDYLKYIKTTFGSNSQLNMITFDDGKYQIKPSDAHKFIRILQNFCFDSIFFRSDQSQKDNFPDRIFFQNDQSTFTHDTLELRDPWTMSYTIKEILGNRFVEPIPFCDLIIFNSDSGIAEFGGSFSFKLNDLFIQPFNHGYAIVTNVSDSTNQRIAITTQDSTKIDRLRINYTNQFKMIQMIMSQNNSKTTININETGRFLEVANHQLPLFIPLSHLKLLFPECHFNYF